VNQVDQHGAAACLAAPLDVEIRVGLVERRERIGRDGPAEPTRLHDLAGTPQYRIVPTMVPDQQRHAGFARGAAHGSRRVDAVRHRFLDQRGDAARDTCEADRHVCRIRRRDDRAVRTHLVEHRRVVGEPAQPLGARELLRCRRRVRDRHHLHLRMHPRAIASSPFRVYVACPRPTG